MPSTIAPVRYTAPAEPVTKGTTLTVAVSSGDTTLWRLADLSPATTGGIGMLARAESLLITRPRAQKCGGVQEKMTPKKASAGGARWAVAGGQTPEGWRA